MKSQLPLEAFAAPDSPYRVYAETGDETALVVWADWLQDRHAGVAGVAEVLDCVRAAMPGAGAEAFARGDYAVSAAPYYLGDAKWAAASVFPDVAVHAKYRTTQNVVVRYAAGVPAALSAPPAWMQAFRPGGGRLRDLLRRYPRMTVYASGVRLHRAPPTEFRPWWGFGYAVHADLRSLADDTPGRRPDALLNAGVIPRELRRFFDPYYVPQFGGGPWPSEYEARAALGAAVRDFTLHAIKAAAAPAGGGDHVPVGDPPYQGGYEEEAEVEAEEEG